MNARPLVLGLMLLLAAAPAVGETIEGVVTNGTLGRPQPGASVALLKPDQGMEPLRETTTDARGRYRLADVPPAGGGAPYLVRVTYAEVSYHQPVLFKGAPTVSVDVAIFERTTSEKDLVVDIHGLSLDPAEGRLGVREAFAVENRSLPPRTIFRSGGTFRFTLPAAAKGVNLSVQGPAGMPLEQTPIEAAPGQYLVDFPLRPGTTQVRLSYQLDYAAARARLALEAFYPVSHTQVFIPSGGVDISSETLKPLGTEPSTKMQVYGVENLSAGAAVEFEISGNPPASARQAVENESEGGVGSVTIFPNAVGQARWYILALTFFVLVLGLYYLYMADRPAESEPAKRASGGKRRRLRREAEPIDDQPLARH